MTTTDPARETLEAALRALDSMQPDPEMGHGRERDEITAALTLLARLLAPADSGRERPSVAAMLDALGWVGVNGSGSGVNVCAEDARTGAVRIDFDHAGNYRCGSRGPRGVWARYDEAVTAAYRYLVGPTELDRVRACLAETQYDLAAARARVVEVEGELAGRCPPDCLSHPSGFYEKRCGELQAERDRLATNAEARERFLTARTNALRECERERDRLAAEVVEVRGALANERGEGEPPCEGWTWNGDSWRSPPHGIVCRGTGDTLWSQHNAVTGWTWRTYTTARDAMRAATDAINNSTPPVFAGEEK